MPFVFGIVGIVFVIAGVRGTSDDLLTLLRGDLIGSENNFFYWIIAIAVLGSLGYVDTFRPLSRALLLLVLVVLILTEGKKEAGGGLFEKFTQAMNQITSEAA